MLFENFLDLFSSHTAYIVALGIFWLFWPGGMFIVGWIGESRLVPVWRHQSRMFFPGDFSLGIMVLALLGMYTRTEIANSYSPLWWICAAMTMAFLAWSIRREDVKHYPPRARTSPTKIIHDVVGYLIIPTMLVGLGVPQIIETIRHHELLDTTWLCWVIFTGAVLFYIGCFIWDAKHPASKEDIDARHPADWQPIWRKDLKH